MIDLISPAFARQCIHDNNLLHVDSLKFFGQGFDNFIFLVNEKFIFRFPKTEEANQLLRSENSILPHLYAILPLQIPNILFCGNPTQDYPYRFHGYEKVQGLSAYQVDFSDNEIKNCLQTLAQFLVALHSIKTPLAKAFGVKNQLYDRTTVLRVIESLQKRMVLVRKKNIIPFDESFIKNEIKQSKKVVFSHNHDCLLHGDLDFRHLLITDKNLTGIIDWSDVGIGHPVVDFVVVHQMFPKSMHEIFFKIYGQVDQEIWRYARFLALHRSITLMLHGYDIQDALLLEGAKKSYMRLQDECSS